MHMTMDLQATTASRLSCRGNPLTGMQSAWKGYQNELCRSAAAGRVAVSVCGCTLTFMRRWSEPESNLTKDASKIGRCAHRLAETARRLCGTGSWLQRSITSARCNRLDEVKWS